MLPRKRQPSPSASAIPSPAGSQESLSASTQRGTDHRSLNAQDGLGSNGRESVSSTVSAAGSGWGSGSGERPPRSGSSQASGGGGAVATGGVTGGDSPVIEEGARNKAKVKSIETIDRLEAPELVRVSLPFKEVGWGRGGGPREGGGEGGEGGYRVFEACGCYLACLEFWQSIHPCLLC